MFIIIKHQTNLKLLKIKTFPSLNKIVKLGKKTKIETSLPNFFAFVFQNK